MIIIFKICLIYLFKEVMVLGLCLVILFFIEGKCENNYIYIDIYNFNLVG